jgi:hypothetical protein
MMQTGGATSSSPWIQEVEFKIAQGDALASAATDYSNPGGSGDRQSSIAVSTDISLAGGSIAARPGGRADDFFRCRRGSAAGIGRASLTSGADALAGTG